MKSFLVISVYLWAFSGCKKSVDGNGRPACLDGKIESFRSEAPCTDPHVDEYQFQGATVYVFNPGTCGADMTSEVIDHDCKHLGFLGGFVGNTKINGEDFSNAKFVKTTWKR